MGKAIILLLLFCGVAITGYYFGLKNGEGKTATLIIDNRQFAKEIAEISSLEITGTQTVKLSNIVKDGSFYNRFKKYFYENTLEVSLPFKAKYGVNLQQADVKIQKITNDSIHVFLPDCKLQSLQLELDKINTSSQSGIFNFSSLEDLKETQKILYLQTTEQLQKNNDYLQKARNNIIRILTNYYKQAGVNAKIFIQSENAKGPSKIN